MRRLVASSAASNCIRRADPLDQGLGVGGVASRQLTQVYASSWGMARP